jgi:hypothetical protein
VVFADMPGETTLTLLIKSKTLKMANKALVILVSFHEILLFSQLGKSVNNNTKQDIVKDNLYKQEEAHVD